MGGSGRSLATILERLDGRCRRVVAVPRGSWMADVLEERGLADEIVWINGFDRARWARPADALTLLRWARAHRGELAAIHANGLAELNITTGAARAARVPHIVWVHDWQFTGWVRRLVPVLRRAAPVTFVSVSQATARELVAEGIAADAHVIPNPIDPNDVLTDHRDEPGPLRVGYLGDAARYKGFHLLPAVARALDPATARLLVYSGPPESMPVVWDELEELGDERVELAKRVNDVREAYARCDIIISPSLRESFGRVVAEAMLNGIPVIASDIAALREVVGDAGVLVRPNDPAAIAGAITDLAADPDRRAELAAAGRAAAAARFAPAAVVDAFAKLYDLPG
jgi:glycosyltransferase involved in cell wall biosynthesis